MITSSIASLNIVGKYMKNSQCILDLQKSSFAKINPRENVSAYSMARASASFSRNLKLVSAIFMKFLFFHQMIAFQNLWKMFFISSKKLFSFSRYSIFCIFSLSTLSRFTRTSASGMIYDVMNWRS